MRGRCSFKSENFGSLSEVLSRCLNLREDGFWSFRGQRKEDWNLGLHGYGATRWLDEHVHQFKKRCMEIISPPHVHENDPWRWLFFAQHYRLKTRLLDWTTNPLVAIYFAVENILSRGNDRDDFGVVWALRVSRKNFKTPEEIKGPEKVSDWLLINPPPVTSRLARQSGKFTFHPGNDLQPLDTVPRRSGEELIKISLKGGKGKNPAADIRKQLGILNIHHAALFPDPDGIAHFLNTEWRDIADEEFLQLRSVSERRANNTAAQADGFAT
jgi:hypothetical protein